MKHAWNSNKLRIDFLSKSSNNRWGCEGRWGNDAKIKRKNMKSSAWFILEDSFRIINSERRFFLLTGFKAASDAVFIKKLPNPKLSMSWQSVKNKFNELRKHSTKYFSCRNFLTNQLIVVSCGVVNYVLKSMRRISLVSLHYANNIMKFYL